MRIPQILFIILTALPWLPGCGAPDPTFVYNDKTNELVREAGAAVKEYVDDGFGSPVHSVAWMKMPIDYGILAGTVEGHVEAEQGTHQLKVKFDTAKTDAASAGDASSDDEAVAEGDDPPEGEGKIAPDPAEINFSGLGLRWTSGPYAAGAEIEGGRHAGEPIAAMQISGFDPATGILSLRQRMNPPPSAGDTFEIVGHKLAAGRQLYAAQCQHCHGVSGDGAGPTARYLNPLPRDYRPGKFKFQSTQKTDRPTDGDLKRIITKGIPGTYMPSFLLLEEDELEAIVQYVKWLSMRGEYELKLDNRLYFTYEEGTFQQIIDQEREQSPEDFDEDAFRESLLGEGSELADLPEISETESEVLANAWTSGKVIVPSVARKPDTPESRAHGRQLYIKNCAACHGATGRGDGEQVEAYMVNDATRERYPEPGLFDDWGRPIKPRDLTRGIYRGGRRPVDLYRRMYEGINGTPMPPFKGKIKDDEIWDLVNYVYHIPFDNRQAPPAASTKSKQTAGMTPANK